MKKYHLLNAALFAAALLWTLPGVAQAQKSSLRYSIISLGTLPGFTRSLAYGLNDKGEVVGSLESGFDLPSHVFFWTKGRLHDLGTIPSPYGANSAFAIEKVCLNNQGMIVVSWSESFDGAYIGDRQVVSVRRQGHWQNLPLLPGFDDNASATVNERGDIALTADHTSSTRHAFTPPYDPPHAAFYSNGHFTDLGPGEASGLNNTGEICGFVNRDAKGFARPSYVNPNESQVVSAFQVRNGKRTRIGEGLTTAVNDQGVLIGQVGGMPTPQGYSFSNALPAQWQNGKMSLLPVQRGEHAVPAAINNRGQIVGGHWLWERGQKYNLNSFVSERSGWTHLQAKAINDHGLIAGWGMFRGKTRAFLMTPSK